MRAYFSDPGLLARVARQMAELSKLKSNSNATPAVTYEAMLRGRWPLSNIWLGISAGDQQRAEERIPELLETPAAVRFLSLEPLIGAIDIRRWLPLPRGPMLASKAAKRWSEFRWPEWVPAEVRGQIESFWSEAYGRNPQQWIENSYDRYNHAPSFGERVRLRFGGERWVEGRYVHCWNNVGRVVEDGGTFWVVGTCDYKRPIGISWVIVGGESGGGARPMHPEWVSAIQEACEEARVPFFFKQWGEWAMRMLGVPMPDRGAMVRLTRGGRNGQDLAAAEDGGDVWMQRVGKKSAGRLLDGREWSEMPEVRTA
jgi:hypothetical protein